MDISPAGKKNKRAKRGKSAPHYFRPLKIAGAAGGVALAVGLLIAGQVVGKNASDDKYQAYRDYSVEGVSRRLGPDYASYHPSGGGGFPEIYLVPAKKMPAEAGPEAVRYYQLGGPYRQEAGDFSSTQGQVLYVPDRPLALEGEKRLPNAGVGVDRVTIIEMSHHCFSEQPQAPWWGDGSRPEPKAKAWIDAAGLEIGSPIAAARGMGTWSNCSLVLFSSGFIGTAGTVTGYGTGPTFRFPKTKIPTAISVTNKNEMALVTVIDAETGKGQVAVLALASGGKISQMPHEWSEENPLLPNIAVFTRIKLLGYVDLPGLNFPTGVCAVGNRQGGRVSGRSGHAGMLSEFDLNVQSDRDNFFSGHNAGYTSTAGFAVVISKSEGKAAFLDLQPIFEEARNAYYTTAENFQKTRDVGDGPKQWPQTFEQRPAWKPTVVKVVEVSSPTAVLASLEGGENARAFIASLDGTVAIFKVGGLATEAPVDPDAIAAVGTVKVGRNPTCLVYDKYATASFLAVCRGDREIDWVEVRGDKGRVARRLRDERLIDPVYAEVADTHGIEAPILTVADFKGRKIVNYRYGELIFATQGREKFGVGRNGKEEFECGGVMEFPGHPFCVSATNVN